MKDEKPVRVYSGSVALDSSESSDTFSITPTPVATSTPIYQKRDTVLEPVATSTPTYPGREVVLEPVATSTPTYPSFQRENVMHGATQVDEHTDFLHYIINLFSACMPKRIERTFMLLLPCFIIFKKTILSFRCKS